MVGHGDQPDADQPPLPEVATIAERLAEIRSRIEGTGVDPAKVTVVAVTKTFPPGLTERAMAAGLNCLGENYAQDLVAKAVITADKGGDQPRWHFIGGLQRNKVKRLAPHVDLWQTIDRSALVAEVAKRAPGARILLQINTTDEPQKSGCLPSEAERLRDEAAAAGLDVAGLMTVGPTAQVDPRPAFDRLAELGAKLGTRELSMGMTGDFEAAVERGATMVRVGSALFGPRS